MEPLVFKAAETIDLWRNATFDEAWVEARIRENPQILPLGGDIKIKNHQAAQKGAGRLDLLADDVKAAQRYVIELMLGPLDADHLMRVMDYWLRENRREANSDVTVIAVLAAERVLLSRYYPLVQFLAEKLGPNLPFVVLEMKALRVGDAVTLSFFRVVDSSQQQTDEETISTTPIADRTAWCAYASEEAILVVDDIVGKLSKLDAKISARYTQNYIGLTYGLRANNFVWFDPQKKFIQVRIRAKSPEHWVHKFDSTAIAARDAQDGFVKLSLTKSLLDANIDLICDLLKESYEEYARSS